VNWSAVLVRDMQVGVATVTSTVPLPDGLIAVMLAAETLNCVRETGLPPK
jgi:hypothetical protein